MEKGSGWFFNGNPVTLAGVPISVVPGTFGRRSIIVERCRYSG